MSLYRFLRALCSPVIKLIWPTKVVGKENLDSLDGGAQVICNHYSKLDGILAGVRLFKDEFHVLAKAEAFDKKIGNWFLREMGAIPVRRGEADIDAVKAVLKVIKDGNKLLVFPEGTRNREGTEQMGEFKQGTARFAIKTKTPIVPMLYYRMHKPFRRNYLYIGKPIDMSEFYGCRRSEDYERATQHIFDKMVELRAEMNAYVENRKKGGK